MSEETRPLLQPESATNYRGGRFVPIEVVSCLYFIATFISLPITSFYVLGRIEANYGYNSSLSSECGSNQSAISKKIEDEKAQYLMYITFISCFPAFIPVLFLGSFMDKYGRKRPLMVTICGSIVKQVIYLVVILTHVRIEYLFIGNAIEGLTGYFGGTLMGLFSILSDVTEVGKSRAFRMVFAEFLFAVCGSISEFLCGYSIKNGTNYGYGMIVCICLTTCSLLFLVFLIPETHNGTRLTGNVISFSTIKRAAHFYIRDTDDHRRCRMILAIVVVFLTIGVHLSTSTLALLFLQSFPLCWKEFKITTFKSAAYISQWFFSIVTAKALQRFLNYRELSIAGLGCLSTIIYLVLFGLANKEHEWLVYVGAVGGMCYLTTISMLRAYMSGQCPSTEQGSLFAGIACVEMLVTSLAGIVFTQIYKATITLYHGLVFFVMAGVMVLALIFLTHLFYKERPMATSARNERYRPKAATES